MADGHLEQIALSTSTPAGHILKDQSGNRREFYQHVLSDLEPFVANHFTAAMTNTIDFKCSECGQSVVISHEGLKSTGRATCLNCLLRYSHREQDGSHSSSWKSRPSSAKNVTNRSIYRLPSLKTTTSFSAATAKLAIELLWKDGVFSVSSKQPRMRLNLRRPILTSIHQAGLSPFRSCVLLASP